MAAIELNSICRLCVKLLEREKVSPIFNNEMYNDNVSLPERIRYCSSVEVAEDDGLPPQICNNCLLKLNQSFSFRNQCVLADITLKRLKDVNYSVDEIPNLLKIDIENEIIKSENYNSEHKKDSGPAVEEGQNEKICGDFDEYDNSKNGRHIKTINKSNGGAVQSIKTLGGKTKEDMCLSGDQRISKKVSQSSTQISSKQKKEKLKKKKSSIENHVKMKKSLRKQKENEVDKSEGKMEVNFEKKTEVENFTIEPDMYSFSGINDEIIKNEKFESNAEESSQKSVKKIVKPKNLEVKKKRSKKVTTAKEKPTSYTCDYCQKVYPSEGGWRYHIHTMHNENYQPFICDLCGQTFKVKKNLEGHKNSIHFHLKHHLCDLCGRGFASKYALKVHKIWHNDEKNFTCDICGTKFRTRGKMNTHRSIHGGPKKFMCHICSRDFRWKKDFEIHMRTHTGEKPFRCSHCGKAFASLPNMKKHERNHGGKRNVGKNSDEFETIVPAVDERMYRNEFMDFEYGSEDVGYRQISQV